MVKTINFAVVSYIDKNDEEEIINLQEQVSKITGSRDALNFWKPHLTIGSGVKAKESEISSLYARMSLIASKHPPFKIKIKGYSFPDDFPGENPNEENYMVNLKVEQNKSLSKLVRDVESNISGHYELWYNQPTPYAPHITLGYGFSREKYNTLKDKLKNEKFSKEALINNLSLASKNPEGKWECSNNPFLLS